LRTTRPQNGEIGGKNKGKKNGQGRERDIERGELREKQPGYTKTRERRRIAGLLPKKGTGKEARVIPGTPFGGKGGEDGADLLSRQGRPTAGHREKGAGKAGELLEGGLKSSR